MSSTWLRVGGAVSRGWVNVAPLWAVCRSILMQLFPIVSRSSTSSCAIVKHFIESDHVPEDLSICLVDQLPSRHRAKPALIPALRKRYEYIWIHRLNARLNKKRFIWHCFSGDLAARKPE